jgi:hypothetical protein
MTGSATFPTSAATDSQNNTTTITLPSAGIDPILSYAYNNNLYTVIITPTSDTTAVGAYWVTKSQNSFVVRCSGRAPVNSTFDWMVVLKEFAVPKGSLGSN